MTSSSSRGSADYSMSPNCRLEAGNSTITKSSTNEELKQPNISSMAVPDIERFRRLDNRLDNP
jgi:hypothetical protein